jgi:hypothetical protein
MKIGIKQGIQEIIKNLDQVLSKFNGNTKVISKTLIYKKS